MAVNVLSSSVSGLASTSTTAQPTGRNRVDSGGFREALQGFRESELGRTPTPATSLKFSNHAIERMQLRGIRFDPTQLKKIDEAVQKAADKGARNTLLLTDNSAMIVSVKDRTVVTVLDRAGMKDNVFTNIDSTVMV